MGLPEKTTTSILHNGGIAFDESFRILHIKEEVPVCSTHAGSERRSELFLAKSAIVLCVDLEYYRV